jgi:hypothetical protein
MVISYGSNSITVKIKPDFQPLTTHALNWFTVGNGDKCATDRGAASDQYDCDVKLYGKETDINTFIDFVEANRNDNTHQCKLSLGSFNSQEKIFGCDVVYSGNIAATAFMGRREQHTLKGWGLPITLKAISPTFVTGSGFPVLKNITPNVDADSDYSINKLESYNRTFSYQEHSTDTGSFTATYILNETEMINLRSFIRTNRATKFLAPPLVGISKPFGRRAYSEYVRLKDFEDQGMTGGFVNGLPQWQCKFTLCEAL